MCGGMVPGLSIRLHPPGEIPSLINSIAKVQINNIAKISIKPKKMKISKGLEKLQPNV